MTVRSSAFSGPSLDTTRHKLDPFQRLALLTTAATYALIAVGGLVRASGSGLGCPDWPRCFGRWYPPLSAAGVPSGIDPALFNFAKAWTEYVNRLLGVAVGFLILGTLVQAIRRYRRVPRVLWPSIAAFLLVAAEGGIGGRVVASRLSPAVLTVHLVFALTIVSLLLYATVSAFFSGGRPARPLSPARRTLGRAGVVVTLLALAQTGIGAAVRGEVQLAGAAGGPRASWVAQAGGLVAVHQALAALVAAAVIGLAWLVYQRADADPWLRGSAGVAVALVVAQGLGGAFLVSSALPPAVQVAHLCGGTLLLGALTALVLLAYRLDPRLAAPVSHVDSDVPGSEGARPC